MLKESAIVHCMLSCRQGRAHNKLSSFISVTHLRVFCLSGDSMRNEGGLVGHIGRVCVLAEVDCGMVSGPAHCHHTDSLSAMKCCKTSRGALTSCIL